MIDPSAFIHPQSCVDVERVSIGARTRIWQFASVIRGTVLGEDCNVASCATLDGPKFGNRCIISQGVAMGPGFMFGDDCFVGPNVVVCNDRWPRADKDGFDLSAFQEGFFTVLVGHKTSIGANATILPGVIIGAGCMIAAGAVVDRDVPADHLFRRDGGMRKLDGRFPRRMLMRGGHAS
jgi:UDP-2-acetamido-3-amino-2,3-dideoxy-glucuronate N-acetyltransferase